MAEIEYLATQAGVAVGAAGSHVKLLAINVTKATSTSVITLYSGVSTGGKLLATIDGGVAASWNFYGARFPDGLFVNQATASADISVVYE